MIVGRNNVKQGKPFDDSPTYLAHSHANELVSVSSDKTWCRTVLENFSSTETVIFVCLTSADLITGWHKQLPSWKRCWPFEEVFNRLHVLSHKTPLKGHMFTSVLRACFLPILQTILVNKQLRRQGNDTLFFRCFTTGTWKPLSKAWSELTLLSLTSAVLSWQDQRWRANWSDKPLSSSDEFLRRLIIFNCCPLHMHRKKQRECPNPLFLKWLEEWRDEAKQKNSKLQYTYAKVRGVNHKHTTYTRAWA